MLRNVFLKTLRDQRRAFLWWGIGLIALALYIILFYPSMRNSIAEITRLMEQMPPALKAMFGTFDFTSLVGYLQGYIFSYLAPLLFLIVSIGFGADAIAGEEKRGTLDLLLSNPLPRQQVVDIPALFHLQFADLGQHEARAETRRLFVRERHR